MKFGTTYSDRYIAYLKLDQQQAFDEVLNFGFDTIRLGCYWSEIEKQPGTYDFSVIRSMLDLCEKKNQKVVLTIGMKGPRDPEYHVPLIHRPIDFEKLEPPILTFLSKCIDVLRHYSCITHWQVENEPLDPSGRQSLSIPLNLLEKEVQMVRSKDQSRKIVLTFWGNEITSRNIYPHLVDLTDILGIDLYYKVPMTKFLYCGPEEDEKSLKEILEKTGKELWVTELQAEPWELKQNLTLDDQPSFNVEQLSNNIKSARALNPRVLFLWGYEYWYWRKIQGDFHLWDVIKSFVQSHK